ncbi:MAG: hypothetical protein AAGA80_26335 [Cyanobacteria bacterium P01_F01_bin.143]
MNQAFWRLTVAFAIIISLAGIKGEARTNGNNSWQISQSTEIANNEQLLNVLVPPSAIIRFKQGGSSTGELIAFNSQDLVISASGSSATVALSEITEVEFQGDIWISTPNGTRKRVPIRGTSIPLEAVPVSALNLDNSPSTAEINLENVLSKEEFDKLTGQTNRIHVIKKILFESSEKITIRIVGARK